MLNILIKDTVTYEQDEVEGESPTPTFNGRLPPPTVAPLAKSKSVWGDSFSRPSRRTIWNLLHQIVARTVNYCLPSEPVSKWPGSAADWRVGVKKKEKLSACKNFMLWDQ